MYADCPQCGKRVAMLTREEPSAYDGMIPIEWRHWISWQCMWCDAAGVRDLVTVKLIPGVL